MVDVCSERRLCRGDNAFDLLQPSIIECSMRATKLISSLQVAQFDAQDGALDSIHPTIPSDHSMVIFADLPVVSQDPDFLVQLRIVGYDSAGFTEGSEVFPRIKAETSGVTQRADPSPAVFGS